MRDIKIRFWDKENNCMVYQNKESLYPLSLYKIVCDCFTSFQFMLFKLKNNRGMFEEVESIKMQYTGLEDINGTKIYEGDILMDHSELGKVIFDEGCFRVCWQGIIEDLFENCNNYEVVGNIYENPKLLERVD